MLNDRVYYQDVTLVCFVATTFTRGATKSSWTTHCEQHISPLFRPCFVNYNTQIMSWKKPTPERSTRELDAGVHHRGSFQIHSGPCLLGHKLQYTERVRRWFDLSVDNRWSAVGSPWTSNGRMVGSMAISPNESMVVHSFCHSPNAAALTKWLSDLSCWRSS